MTDQHQQRERRLLRIPELFSVVFATKFQIFSDSQSGKIVIKIRIARRVITIIETAGRRSG